MQAPKTDPEWAHQECATERLTSWLNALQRGCLSKAVNNKDALYSHLKALSARQLGRSNLFPDPPLDVEPLTHVVEGLDGEEEELFDLAEAEKRFQPALRSPVILEDLTLPPAAVQDATSAFFTAYEFLDILTSPVWLESIRLRVLGGDLLNVLNAALVCLEKRRLVNLHSTYANANNRVSKTVINNRGSDNEEQTQKNIALAQTADVPPKGKGKSRESKKKMDDISEKMEEMSQPATRRTSAEPLATTMPASPAEFVKEISYVKLVPPKAFQADPEYEYERLGLEIVFYEKTERSNIPCIIPDFTKISYFEDVPPPKVLPRSLKRDPLSYEVYNVEKFRLPPFEDIDPKDTIAFKTLEVVELREKQERAEEEAKIKALVEKAEKAGKTAIKDVKGKEQARDSEPTVEEQAIIKSFLIPEVEDVADDPSLELVRPEPATRTSLNQLRASTKTYREVEQQKKLSKVSATSVKEVPSKLQSVPSVRLTPQRVSSVRGSDLPTPARSQEDEESVSPSLDPTLMNVSGSESGSFDSLGSSWADEDEELESSWWHSEAEPRRLDLTRRELYVSSLYAAREANKQPLQERLEANRRSRAKMQARTVRQALVLAQQRTKGDLHANFKHLARKCEAQRLRASLPNVSRPPAHVLARNRSKPLPTILGQGAHDQSKLPNTQSTAPPGTADKSCPIAANAAKQWERYRILEDTCEVEAALINESEKQMLERMPNRDFFPNYKPRKPDDTGGPKEKTKGKSDKNKSHNRNFDINGSWFNEAMFKQNCDCVSRNYPNYELFLKMNGQTTRVTQPVLKKNIIQSSFCMNKLGTIGAKPSVRRIGFRNPEQLIHYLVSVRSALQEGVWPELWRPADSGNIYEHFNRGSSAYASRRGSATLCNSNNNGRLSRKQKQFKVVARKSTLNASRSNNHLNSSGNAELIGETYRNRNRSAGSRDSSVAELANSKGSETEQRSEQEDETLEDAEAEEDDDHVSVSLAMTASEMLECDLKCYGVSCQCKECVDQAPYLSHLKPTCQKFTQREGCPPVLGRLRRDFHFLKATKRLSQETTDKRDSTGRLKLPARPLVLDNIQVGNRLLDVMGEVMIRKEILTSTRGFTYTTITFTRRQTTAVRPCETKGRTSPPVRRT